jgi:hypothetical protein
MDLERYKDKPFLLMLESYVMDAIGQLPPAMEQLTKSMSRKLFGAGDWRTRLREEVGFDKSLDAQLAQLWKENQQIAKEKGATLEAQDFAQALVEANFSQIIEMASSDIEAEEGSKPGVDEDS